MTLEVECLDRIYLNAYVPNLQVGGQVVRFLTEHLGSPIPSPALSSLVVLYERLPTMITLALRSRLSPAHVKRTQQWTLTCRQRSGG